MYQWPQRIDLVSQPNPLPPRAQQPSNLDPGIINSRLLNQILQKSSMTLSCNTPSVSSRSTIISRCTSLFGRSRSTRLRGSPCNCLRVCSCSLPCWPRFWTLLWVQNRHFRGCHLRCLLCGWFHGQGARLRFHDSLWAQLLSSGDENYR